MPHFSIFTATGAYNLGDELILLQEYEYLKNRYPEATFTIFTYDEKSSLLPKDLRIRYISYFPNHLRSKPFQNILYFFQTVREIWKTDTVIIGGGGLLYDDEKDQSFDSLLLQWKIRVWLAKLFGKLIVYWSLGIHVKSENAMKVAPLFAGKHIFTSVRDIESKNILESIGIESTLIPDPVLLYDPKTFKSHEKKFPKIGLSFRSGYLPNELENIENSLVFLKEKGYEVVLLNHSFHPRNPKTNDNCFLEGLAEKYQLTSTKTIEETLKTYRELDYVVGMRLHSLILSLVHKIPFLAISYSEKTGAFLRNIDHHFSIKASVFDMETFEKLFLELEQQKSTQIFALGTKYDTIKGEMQFTTNIFFDGLEQTQGFGK